jgi:dTDP-4-dehydrorhamnose reductase
VSALHILGAGGMLGQALLKEFSAEGAIGSTRENVDLTSMGQLEDFISPGSTVINAAAYTQVDAAETHREDAFAINAEGVANLARVGAAKNARVVHISTDYVFAGDEQVPYEVNDAPNPRSVYGESKLAGELSLQEILPEDSVILRTAWLYGFPGSSFPKTILNAARTRDTLQVVTDQIGQPTWTGDVARMVRAVVERPEVSGIFHATNSGQASWWDFARALFEKAGLDPHRVEPTTSDTFVRPAPRPAWSVLSHSAWANQGFPTPRHWREALDDAWDAELHAITKDGRDQ